MFIVKELKKERSVKNYNKVYFDEQVFGPILNTPNSKFKIM